MVSITLSVPEEVRQKMNKFNEINWSGFVRKCILEKTEELSKKEKLQRDFEKEPTAWAVELGRKAKKGRYAELKRKGLL